MLVEGSPSGKYTVRLVNPNGSREEAIRDILEAVDNLDLIASSIFSTIRKRLTDQKRQLSCLDQRIDSACLKIDKIKESKRGIRVVSPAKYPLDSLDPYLLPPMVLPPLKETQGKEEDDGEIVMPDRRRTWPTRFDPPVKHPDELLSCYHVREPILPPFKHALQQPGLRNPPSSAHLVDSFLVFNTAENPFLHYRIPGKHLPHHQLDALLPPSIHAKGKDKQEDKSALFVPEDEGGDGDDDKAEEFYYSPSTFQQIPDIEVPDLLPDLQGVVADNLLDFNQMQSDFFSFPQRRSPSSARSSSTSTAVDPKKGTTTASSVPPPRSVEDDNLPSASTAVKPSSSIATTPSVSTPRVPSGPPAPPPPPPPASGPPAFAVSGSGGDDGTMRNNLMAAIRATGGALKANLRSAQERKYEAKKKKQEEKGKAEANKAKNIEEEEGGDLMADLKNTLAMRRKGISGIREGPRAGAGAAIGMGGILQQLASTIPTFETSTDSRDYEEDDDSDDADVEDWN